MPRKKFDPRLKAAMAEINAVLKRYDIAGHVVLVSPSHSEFRTAFPTWSVAQYEHNSKGKAVGIRFNNNRHTFATPQGKHAATESTVHIIDQLRHNAAIHFSVMDEIMSRLSEYMAIESDIRAMHPHDIDGERAGYEERNRREGGSE